MCCTFAAVPDAAFPLHKAPTLAEAPVPLTAQPAPSHVLFDITEL